MWEVLSPADGVEVSEAKNKTARVQLLSTLSEDIFMQVSTKKKTKEVWDNLKTRFVGADRIKSARLFTLRGKFDKLNMADGDLLDDYAGKISGMSARRWLGSSNSVTPETMALEEALGRLKAFDERSRRARRPAVVNGVMASSCSRRPSGSLKKGQSPRRRKVNATIVVFVDIFQGMSKSKKGRSTPHDGYDELALL
uniref:Uncharacterized protein n=4 Tax=Avena sativa TaxID=4498 RepID=A0ACD5WYB8_AVESA